MHFIDKLGDMFGRGELRNAVPQIEHVPRVIAVTVEHRPRLDAQGFGRREQRCRIEIALQRDARADALPCPPEVDCPIHAYRIDAARGDILEPKAAPSKSALKQA